MYSDNDKVGREGLGRYERSREGVGVQRGEERIAAAAEEGKSISRRLTR